MNYNGNGIAQEHRQLCFYLYRLIRQLQSRSFVRWWIVGLSFTAGALGVLYVLHDVLRLSLIVSTSAGTEVMLVLRFLINDRWVFGYRRPTWARLWQFHVASAGGGAVWWIVVNLLPRFGVHYLLAALAATACSVLVSMATNFFWIWRSRDSERIQPVMLESTPRCTPIDGIKSNRSA